MAQKTETHMSGSYSPPIQMKAMRRSNSNDSSDSGGGPSSSSEGSIETNLRHQQQMRLGLDEPSPLSCFFSALTRKKPLDCRTDTNLNRCLNLVDLTALGVGSTLGLGLYVLAGQVASNKAGPAVVVSFGLAALASAFSALCYAEFAGRVPRAGSAYAYSYITVGEFVAFVIGWNLILEYVIGASSVARGFSGYLCFVYEHVMSIISVPTSIPNHSGNHTVVDSFNQSISSNQTNTSPILQADTSSAATIVTNLTTSAALIVGANGTLTSNISAAAAPPWTESIIDYLYRYFDWPSVVIILMVTIFILLGVKGSTNVTLAFTSLNLLVVVVTVISSINSLDIHNWRLSKSEVPHGYGEGGFLPYGWSGVLAGSATCFFGFIGFDTIASSAEEAKNPKRNVPLSILLSLFISFVTYMAVAIVQTLLWPYYDQNKVTILPYIFGRLDMPITYWVVLLGAIAGLASSQLGGMYPLPRILYSMAHDKLIYGYLSHVNEKLKLPVRATIAGSILVAMLSCLLDIQDLADMVSIGTLAAYSLVSISVLIIRYGDQREAVDDSTINNNHLAFTEIIGTTMEPQSGWEIQQYQSRSMNADNHRQKIETNTEVSQHVKLGAKESIRFADAQQNQHKKLGPKPSTPIREKGSKPLVPQLSVGFQSWFKSTDNGLESGTVLSSAGNEGTRQPADGARQAKGRSILDLLITWKADDQIKVRRPDDESSRQSKILISLLVILTIVLDIVAICLTNMPGDQETSTQLTASEQQSFPIDPKLLLGSTGCIVAVVLAAAMLMLSRLPVSNSMPSDMFQVPLVPLIPTLSILVNTFLMLNLSYLTWVRFIVWMALGLFIYFTYGIWNSQGYLFYLGR